MRSYKVKALPPPLNLASLTGESEKEVNLGAAIKNIHWQRNYG